MANPPAERNVALTEVHKIIGELAPKSISIQFAESTAITQSELTHILYPNQQNLTEWATWL